MKHTLYPLTTGQEVQQLLVKEFHTAQVLNIGVCLSLQANLDFELLKKCILEEYERYECLRVRFTPMDKNQNVKQYISEDENKEIEIVSLEHHTWEEINRIFDEWSSVPFEEPDQQMNKFVMVKLPDGYQGMYVLIDHRLIDSCGIIAMVNDIMGLYCQYQFDAPAPTPFMDYKEAIKKDFERQADEKRVAKDEAFWKEFIAMGEPIYTDVAGSSKLEESRQKYDNPNLRAADRNLEDLSVGWSMYHLEPEATQKLFDYCLNNQVTMTNLLLMGLRTYLSKMNNNEKDISVRNFVSRRSTKLKRLSGGTRVHCYPCRTIIEPETEFLDGIFMIQDFQNKVYRHVDFDTAKLSQMMSEAWGKPANTTYEGLSLTYQPLPIRLQNQNLQGIKTKTIWCTNGTAVQKAYLTVMHSADDLGLDFFFKYQTAELSEDDIEKFYYYLMRVIFLGVEHPEITVGEILEIV